MAEWETYLQENRDRFLEELMDFVRIPSVSAEPAHADDVVAAAEWVARRLEAAGAENVREIATAGHPCVYGDWLHAGSDQPTVLIYGHFDVQPAEPFDLWDSPPFEPEIRGEMMYGRGASDDKGSMLATIQAFEALLRTGGGAPVNVKFFYEGQEEIGSPQLPEVVAAHRERLACDRIFSADGLQWAADEPNIVIGLKGLVGLEITVAGAKSDLHSGLHGGAIANPLQALSHILAGLKSVDGKILIEGFYDDVVDLTEEGREEIARVPFDEERYKAELGVPDVFGEPGYTTRERNWARPTLELNGFWGGYQGEGSKTVLPREAHAKITCRLIADQNPDRIFEVIEAHIHRTTPAGVTVSVKRLPGSADPFLMPRHDGGMDAARHVLEEIYGKTPYVTRLGGSIPIVSIFQKELGVPTTMFGFSVDDENLHAPNEFFRLRNFDRAQRAYCMLLERLVV